MPPRTKSLRFTAAVMVLGLAAATTATVAATVEGTVTLKGKPTRMTHVAAWLHDNAEGWYEKPLLIVFADRPVAARALVGRIEPEVVRLAEAGQIRGMLVRIDPARAGFATLTLLDAGETGTTYDVSHNTEPVVAGLKVGGGSVEGTMKSVRAENTAGYALRFSSPLGAAAPVSALLKGNGVRASPAYAGASAWVDALGRGDLAAARAKSSGAIRAKLEEQIAAEGPARTAERWKRKAASFRSRLAALTRIVERGSEALLIIDRSDVLVLVCEAGEWKMAEDSDE